MVRVFVEGTPADCVALEDALVRRYGLAFAVVAPNLDGIRAAAAHARATPARASCTACWRTGQRGSSASATAAPWRRSWTTCRGWPARGVQFVSLLGGLPATPAPTPSTSSIVWPNGPAARAISCRCPFFVDSLTTRPCSSGTAEPAPRVRARRAGPSSASSASARSATTPSCGSRGMISDASCGSCSEAGAVGEVLGLFLDARGQPLDVDLNQPLDRPRARRPARQARWSPSPAGTGKIAAIDAVLRDRCDHGPDHRRGDRARASSSRAGVQLTASGQPDRRTGER